MPRITTLTLSDCDSIPKLSARVAQVFGLSQLSEIVFHNGIDTIFSGSKRYRVLNAGTNVRSRVIECFAQQNRHNYPILEEVFKDTSRSREEQASLQHLISALNQINR